jgi:chemotaxis signal transduction protein
MSLRGHRVRKTSVAPTFRVLVVTVGGAQFALHADRVQGLLTIEEAGSAGALTVQGVTYAGIDLAPRLQLPVDTDGPETRVVLLSHGTARGNIRVAQVHGLKELEQTQLLPLPRHFQGEEQGWYQGMILFEESVALVLASTWLMHGRGTGQVAGALEQPAAFPQFLPTRPIVVEGQV